MPTRFFSVFCILTSTGLLHAQQVSPESLVLDNGMEFLLMPRTEQPNSVAAGWAAKVGSVNERPGITGISHFFEHMMFKGTTTIGTHDAQRDREIIDELAELRHQLRDRHLDQQYQRFLAGEIDDPWSKDADDEEMAEIRTAFTKLLEEQRENTVKDEFDQVYTKMGASGMNAFTSHDFTFYFINVPSNKFELWAWMESDRLNDSVFREFYAERDVVHEERRLRTESTPTGIFQEQFDAMFWQSSPYSWPVIGWTSDLNSYTREQAEEYYRTYYGPGNLVGVIVGDFKVEEVKPVIEKYFSRLKPGPTPPPVVTLEMKQLAEKRMYAEGDCQPQIEIRYHAVPWRHADSYALEMMSEVLNGRTGRLYKAMVEGKEIAATASAGLDSRKYQGAYSFSAECKKDATPEDLEAAWEEILTELQQNPVSERELQKVKNQVLADSYRRLQSNFFLLIQLGIFEAQGGWEYINESPSKLRAVTAEDIRRVANTYFAKENRSVAIYRRKAGAAPEDPELAALDPQARAMVKQAIAQFASVDDVDQLREVHARMETGISQAPAEMAPALQYMLKKLQERIDALGSAGQE